MQKKAAALVLVCAGLATWSACGKKSNNYVYGALPAVSQIAIFREDPNSGTLTSLATSPVTAGPGVQSIAIHPSNKFLYASNAGEGDISLFTISTGTLTEVTPRTVVGTTPTQLIMDSAGTFLYVANVGSNNISVFSIDSSSGALTAVAGSPFQIGLPPINMRLSPSGSVLYVTGANGGGQPGVIQGFNVNAGVITTVVPGSPFQAGTTPIGLAIDSTGSHLYTSNAAPDNSISEFTINSDGSLTQLPGSPIGESYSNPISLLIDVTGKYLFVTNQGSNNVAAYSIGSDGSLTLLTNSPFATGAQPNSIGTDPSGRYIFIGNQTSSAIQSFNLDRSTGTLTSVASYAVGGTPTSIAVSP
jgi:6-phosphogluconolactonase